ncbi:MAG: hypothetical protein ACOC07_14375, partial [Coleofasciculus sp.]|uniref:hypothetical protein n=1 Tax=Coleofasciculus sp. TaxID=3100458 RepID=UPI003A343AA2
RRRAGFVEWLSVDSKIKWLNPPLQLPLKIPLHLTDVAAERLYSPLMSTNGLGFAISNQST